MGRLVPGFRVGVISISFWPRDGWDGGGFLYAVTVGRFVPLDVMIMGGLIVDPEISADIGGLVGIDTTGRLVVVYFVECFKGWLPAEGVGVLIR